MRPHTVRRPRLALGDGAGTRAREINRIPCFILRSAYSTCRIVTPPTGIHIPPLRYCHRAGPRGPPPVLYPLLPEFPSIVVKCGGSGSSCGRLLCCSCRVLWCVVLVVCLCVWPVSLLTSGIVTGPGRGVPHLYRNLSYRYPKETDSRGRTVAESKASDGVRYAGARSGVGCRVTERYETKIMRLYRWVQVFFLLKEHSKHPREMVITPKASTSTYPLPPVLSQGRGAGSRWAASTAAPKRTQMETGAASRYIIYIYIIYI